MRRTANLGANVTLASSLLFVIGCILLLGLAPVSRPTASGNSSLSQAIVAYGFLRWDYLDFDKLLAADADLAVVKKLKALDVALKSLDCDVPTRLASPHGALILPSSPVDEWVGFPRPQSRNSSDNGWLFVTQPGLAVPQRVLVVFSSASPEHTTIFWLEEADAGYATKLLYDSSKRSKISNEITMIGAVTAVKIGKNGEVLLKDYGEPGVGPREFARVGRVFRLDPSHDTLTLVSPGRPPQH